MAAARAGKLVIVSPTFQVAWIGPLADIACSKAGGAFTFVTSLAGWWIFFAIMLASLDFPFSLPVGDLSHIVKGASEKQKIKDAV